MGQRGHPSPFLEKTPRIADEAEGRTQQITIDGECGLDASPAVIPIFFAVASHHLTICVAMLCCFMPAQRHVIRPQVALLGGSPPRCLPGIPCPSVSPCPSLVTRHSSYETVRQGWGVRKSDVVHQQLTTTKIVRVRFFKFASVGSMHSFKANQGCVCRRSNHFKPNQSDSNQIKPFFILWKTLIGEL